MGNDAEKKLVAKTALQFIEEDAVIGVGTGRTIAYFIEALASIKHKIDSAIASSDATAAQLQSVGIPLQDLNSVGNLSLYIDSADEFNQAKQLLKGGGGALTREKIIATAAKQFICIVDQSKHVEVLGEFPIALEVIPLARSMVARHIVKLGGDPVYREGFVTDNGNVILDIYNLKLVDPITMETQLKAITGVVDSGIFAKRTADRILIAEQDKVRQI